MSVLLYRLQAALGRPVVLPDHDLVPEVRSDKDDICAVCRGEDPVGREDGPPAVVLVNMALDGDLPGERVGSHLLAVDHSLAELGRGLRRDGGLSTTVGEAGRHHREEEAQEAPGERHRRRIRHYAMYSVL